MSRSRHEGYPCASGLSARVAGSQCSPLRNSQKISGSDPIAYWLCSSTIFCVNTHVILRAASESADVEVDMLLGKVSHAASNRLRPTLIKEGHQFWTFHIACVQVCDFKAGTLDQVADRAVQVTPAGNPFPYRRQPVLPSADLLLWSQPMFHEE